MPINAEDLRLQREYIIQQLSLRLLDTAFHSVLPVHQLSAAFYAGITLDNFAGLCHGYNKYWRRVLLNPKHGLPVVNNDLTLAVNENILAWQQERLFTYSFNKLTNGTFKACSSTQELINYLVTRIIFPKLAKNQVLTLGVAEYPKDSNLAAFYLMFPQLIRKMHEISICLDNNGFLHFFDCNIGWFKSNNPNISMQQLNIFLTIIFDIMQYNDLRIAVLFKVYNLNFTKQSKHLLTHS